MTAKAAQDKGGGIYKLRCVSLGIIVIIEEAHGIDALIFLYHGLIQPPCHHYVLEVANMLNPGFDLVRALCECILKNGVHFGKS